jgi:hypothetical protein
MERKGGVVCRALQPCIKGTRPRGESGKGRSTCLPTVSPRGERNEGKGAAHHSSGHSVVQEQDMAQPGARQKLVLTVAEACDARDGSSVIYVNIKTPIRADDTIPTHVQRGCHRDCPRLIRQACEQKRGKVEEQAGVTHKRKLKPLSAKFQVKGTPRRLTLPHQIQS